MELQGETVIAAPRERVWAALNDPAVLQHCIDGVESLERVGDNRFEGKLNAKVGPVRATFTGGVTLENIDPPNGYTLVGEGKGGVAGFAKGSADVVLADETLPDGTTGTRLTYVARSTVGGKLAQLGSRLIEGTARGYAETFFARLKSELEAAGAGTPDLMGEPPSEGLRLLDQGAAADSITSNVMAMGGPSLPTMPVPPMPPGDPKAGTPRVLWGGALALLLILLAWILLAA